MIYLLLDLSLCTEIVLLNEIPSQPVEVKQNALPARKANITELMEREILLFSTIQYS